MNINIFGVINFTGFGEKQLYIFDDLDIFSLWKIQEWSHELCTGKTSA